jgi:hypothetical protein
MSRATMSLPAPLSPTMSTLTRVAATREILCSKSWIVRERPNSRVPSSSDFDISVIALGSFDRNRRGMQKK